MIDRVPGADAAAAQHIAQQQAQQSGQTARAERDVAARTDTAQPAESGQSADSVRAPQATEAQRIASISALRDEALALTRTATEAQLANQAAGRPAIPEQPNAEGGAAALEAEVAAATEAEARQVEAEELASRIRDGGAGQPHGGNQRSDVGAIRDLLGE